MEGLPRIAPERWLEALFTFYLLESAYHFIVSLFGMGDEEAVPQAAPSSRFAVFIPAHNEEAVIAANIRSLFQMNYPRALFDVYVVADHCTDGTAAVARRAGATVLERNEGRPDGKPGALNWGQAQVNGALDRYDALVVVDADNLVAPNFLDAMNRRLLRGERLIQGNLDVKNPGQSWVSGSIALAYWASSRIHQLARSNLGLCAGVGGTGVCIERELFRSVGWNTRSLTEDLDFQIRALRRGVRATWAHEARVFDEKPVDLVASLRQRVRWIRGHLATAIRHVPALLRTAVARRDVVALDAALYLGQPVRLAGTALVLVTWPVWSALGRPHFLIPSYVVLGFAVLYVVQLSQFLYWGAGLVALARERVPVRYYVYYPASLVFGLTWLGVIFTAIVRPHGTWTHTRHTACIDIEERLGQPHEPAAVGRNADEEREAA